MIISLAAILSLLGSAIALSNGLIGASIGYAIIGTCLIGLFFDVRNASAASLIAVSLFGGIVTEDDAVFKVWNTFIPLILVVLIALS